MKRLLMLDQLLTDEIEAALYKAPYISRSYAPAYLPVRVIDSQLLLEANICIIDSASYKVLSVKCCKPRVDAENLKVAIGH
jgi:hypothetical protein